MSTWREGRLAISSTPGIGISISIDVSPNSYDGEETRQDIDISPTTARKVAAALLKFADEAEREA